MAYAYSHVITPSYMAPSDPYHHHRQQLPPQSHMANNATVLPPPTQVTPPSSLGLHQLHYQQQRSQGLRSISYSQDVSGNENHYDRFSYPHRMSSQASRHASYGTGLPQSSANSLPQYGSSNPYHLPYPVKSNNMYGQNQQVGSYSANGMTFFLPNIPVDHGDFISRPQPYHGYHHPSQSQHSVSHQRMQSQQYNNMQNHNNGNEGSVVGGVAAKLDYNLEDMAEFVSTKALEIMYKLNSPSQSADAFCKFTLQVLSATRLPKSTLILALVYLSERSIKGNFPETQCSIPSVYKMLVVALLLANKFHDDNTFTNKSWYEATGVPIQDLSIIEFDWLKTIRWTLHLEKDAGWSGWNDSYNIWVAKRKGYSTPSPQMSYKTTTNSEYSPRENYPLSPLPSPEFGAHKDKISSNGLLPPCSKWYPSHSSSNTNSTNNISSLSRSSSLSTLATPPSARHDSYMPYMYQMSSQYEDNLYSRQHLSNPSYYHSYGNNSCTAYDNIPKMSHWGYSFAAAC